jgi:hypothetical protein
MSNEKATSVETLLGGPGSPLVFGYDRDKQQIVSPGTVSMSKIAEFMKGLEGLHKSTGIRLASKAALSEDYKGTFTRFCLAFNGSSYQMEPAVVTLSAEETTEASHE